MTPLSPHVRLAVAADLGAITRLACALWPDEPEEEHADHARAILAGEPESTLPLVLFVAEVDDAVVGFIEVGLRSHADGCDTRQAVGFIEGWYVEPHVQRRGVGRALMSAAEEWARQQGASELGSDTWIDSPLSQQAHAALGFEVVDRVVNFRKALR